MSNTNEWYIFGAGTVDKKTCNKIKRLRPRISGKNQL